MAWDLNELYGQKNYTIGEINRISRYIEELNSKRQKLQNRNFELDGKLKKYNPFKQQLENSKKTIENAKNNSNDSKNNFSKLLKASSNSGKSNIRDIENTLGSYKDKLNDILTTLTDDCSTVEKIIKDIETEIRKNNDEINKYANAIGTNRILLSQHQSNLQRINEAIATFN